MFLRRHKYLFFLLFFFVFLFSSVTVEAQCSVCTRTAQQLGEKPAKGLNSGILYLAFTPLILIGVIGYRVFRKSRSSEDNTSA